MPSASPDLLSLSDAAALLGVHPATLRRWADQGDVLVMVTPGGHRRFPRTEIERLAGAKAHSEDEDQLAERLVERALTRTREQLAEQPAVEWVTGFNSGERERKRKSGRRLMELLRHSLAADESEQPAILEEARTIGQEYAADAHDLGLAEVLRALTFFRDHTLESVLSAEALAADPQAARRVIQRTNAFFSAILIAVGTAFD